MPDVAGPADPSGSELEAVVWDAKHHRYVATKVGGTSAAAPFWAGATALIGEHLAHAGYVHLLPDPYRRFLYRLLTADADGTAGYVEVLHDITSGSNPLLSASSGYDMLTGLGTPRIGPLATALLAYFENVP